MYDVIELSTAPQSANTSFPQRWQESIGQQLPAIGELFKKLTGLTLHAIWHQPSDWIHSEIAVVLCDDARRLVAGKRSLPRRCAQCQEQRWRAALRTDGRCSFIGNCSATNVCFSIRTVEQRTLSLMFRAHIKDSTSKALNSEIVITSEALGRAEFLLQLIVENFRWSLRAHFLEQQLNASRNSPRSGISSREQQFSFELTDEGSKENLSSAPARNHLVVRAMVWYLHQNFQRPMSLKEVAAHLGMNANYLSTVFRQATGIKFHRFLEGMRITKAKELLRSPHAKIQRIAQEVGYVSGNHFRKVFRSYEGMSPSAWAAPYYLGDPPQNFPPSSQIVRL